MSRRSLGVGPATRRRGARALAALALALVAWAPAASRAEAPEIALDPVAVLSDGILSGDEIHELLAGETVVVRTKEVSQEELAIVLVCLTPESPAGVLEKFRGDPHPLSAGSAAEWVKEVPVAEAGSALAAFTLGAGADAEAKRFVEAVPGFGLNLATAEIARFDALADTPQAARLERVDEVLRTLIAERLSGFARAGLAGVAPYAREGGKQSRPAWELEQSYGAFRVRPPLFPGFAEAWNDYPKGLPEGAPERFLVTRVAIDGRPAVILTHRMEIVAGDRAVLAERDFYVSQFFDSALNAVVVLPSARTKDNLLLFIERVWVDRWNGMVAMKRSLGQKKMSDRLRQNVSARKVCR